jgi:hypothetical protein
VGTNLVAVVIERPADADEPDSSAKQALSS